MKSGWKTSEFWIVSIKSITTVALPIIAIATEGLDKLAGLFPGNQLFAIVALFVGLAFAATSEVNRFVSSRTTLKLSTGNTNVPSLEMSPINADTDKSTVRSPWFVGLLVLVFVMLSLSCGHSLRPFKPIVDDSAVNLTAAQAIDASKRCQFYDDCYLTCSIIAPVFGGLGAASGLTSILIPEQQEGLRLGLQVGSVAAGALGAGASACATQCAALYTDRCAGN